MRDKRFEDIRPGRDVCHQRYVRAACARMRGMRLAESGTGRIWDHYTGHDFIKRDVGFRVLGSKFIIYFLMNNIFLVLMH